MSQANTRATRATRNAAAQQTAVDVNQRAAEFAGTLAKFNPALVPAAKHLALAYDNPNTMLGALADADTVKRAAELATAAQVAEHTLITQKLVADIEDSLAEYAGKEASLASFRSDFLRAWAEKINVYAQNLRLGVVTHEPWFELRADKLPEQINAWRGRLIDVQRAAGHSNPDMSWSRVREYARSHAATCQWWNMTPAVMAGRELLAKAKADLKAAEKEAAGESDTGGKATKTPHQKAAAMVKNLVKLQKKELDTAELTAAMKTLCEAFSLDYGTI